MTDRSGIGPVELAVLQAVGAEAARSPYIGCSHVLPVIEGRTGLGPRYAFDVLLDLARPWVIAVPLVAVHGSIAAGRRALI